MKPQICALMLIGVLSVSPVCYAQTENASTSIEEVKKETQDLLKTIGSYSADKRDEAVEKAKDGLNTLDKRIDALEERMYERWDTLSDAARKEARENLKALQKLRLQAAEWYGSMKASSADAWDHMKQGFSDAYTALEDAWEKSEKEFSSSE